MQTSNCKHENAVFGWSHTEYLGYCSKCQKEVTESEVEEAGESLQDHVEGEVLEDRLNEAEQDVKDQGYASMKDYNESNN